MRRFFVALILFTASGSVADDVTSSSMCPTRVRNLCEGANWPNKKLPYRNKYAAFQNHFAEWQRRCATPVLTAKRLSNNTLLANSTMRKEKVPLKYAGDRRHSTEWFYQPEVRDKAVGSREGCLVYSFGVQYNDEFTNFWCGLAAKWRLGDSISSSSNPLSLSCSLARSELCFSLSLSLPLPRAEGAPTLHLCIHMRAGPLRGAASSHSIRLSTTQPHPTPGAETSPFVHGGCAARPRSRTRWAAVTQTPLCTPRGHDATDWVLGGERAHCARRVLRALLRAAGSQDGPVRQGVWRPLFAQVCSSLATHCSAFNSATTSSSPLITTPQGDHVTDMTCN